MKRLKPEFLNIRVTGETLEHLRVLARVLSGLYCPSDGELAAVATGIIDATHTLYQQYPEEFHGTPLAHP